MSRLRSWVHRLMGRPADTGGPLHLLAVELPPKIRRLTKDVDGELEATLLAGVPALLAQVSTEAMTRRVPSFAKVAYHHLGNRDLASLHDALARDLTDVRRHDASVHAGEPVAHLPGWADESLPRHLFVLADSETPARAEVVRSRVIDDRFHAVVRAGFTHIDAGGEVPTLVVLTKGVAATFVGETSGHRGGASTWRETYDRSTWAIDIPLSRLGPSQSLELELDVSLAGRTGRVRIDLEAPAEPDTASIDRFALEHGTIVVEGSGLTTAPHLVGVTTRLSAIEFSHLDTRFRAVFPAVDDRWGRGPLPLPIGDYVLLADGDAVPLSASLAMWPTDVAEGPLVGHTTATGVALVKPRRPDENTMYGQRALRAAYAAADDPVEPESALFQCYWAEVATDSQAAIHRELVRRRPGLTAWWGVVDHSVALPEGATPVVAGSREWYAALGRAHFLVKNTEVGTYTRLRPGQVYLQTFHGQPFKTMGRPEFQRRMPLWKAEHDATTRRSAFWDVICLPYPDAASFYREAYDWTGPAFDHGLPRTDALLAPDAADVRQRTRALLGLGEDDVAVLHATTWREDLSQGGNTSADPGLLDVRALSAELGEGHVVLQRSHHSVARSDGRVGGGLRVIDVTDHPEINELVLASDMAILDYSSLRFDYAITGKPMIFFVPDLDRYAGELRGFLFDFEQSAPGPLVTDARRLARLIRDPRWIDEYAQAYAAFNDRFNAFHDGHAAERVVDGLLGWDPA